MMKKVATIMRMEFNSMMKKIEMTWRMMRRDNLKVMMSL